MIENLNAISFNKFGRIITEGFLHACNLIDYFILSIRQTDLKPGNPGKLLCVKGSPVVMDIVDGIALVCTTLDPGSASNLEVFLLDKTIYINPGVYYSVTPLYGSCVIKTAFKEDAPAEEHEYSGKLTPFGFYPKVDINKVHTLFYQEKERGFIFKGERHSFWELTYIDRGVMNNIVDERGFRLHQGDVIFYATDQYHVQWSEEDASVCFITITFDMDFEESSLLTGRTFQADDEVRTLLEKIIYEREHGTYYSEDLIICYLKELIIRLIRNEKLENEIYRQETQVKYKIENSIIEKCTGYIRKNISRKMSIADIAGSIPISQSYLSSVFKKHMGMTLVDYINNYRLEKSKDLVRSSEYNFTQIADKLGYTSVHYFSSQFKQKYGVSPREYARTIRRNP